MIRQFAFVSLLMLLNVAAPAAAIKRLPGLQGKVDTYRDRYGVPHIHAQSWPDALRVLGYLHATDRLWQMDMFRRQASGELAEILGPDSIPGDTLMRQLGVRRSCEQVWNGGSLPQAFRSEMEAYAAGVNAKIGELGSTGLPPAFSALGYKPRSWTPVDSLVFSKYMGWDQSGTFDDLWFGAMVEQIGIPAVEELWPLDRPYEISSVGRQATRPAPKNSAARGARDMERALQVARGGGAALLPLFDRLQTVPWLARGDSFGSNNWAVDGTKTASKKPMLCNDPHLGFMLPSIWYAASFSIAGFNLAGATFPGGPVVVIGHNDHIAWGVTNMQADAVDFFLETIDPTDPKKYRHRGQTLTMESVVEKIAVRGQDAETLVVDSTVHGPIVQRGEQTVSLQWTGLGPTNDVLSFWRLNRGKNLNDFLAAVDELKVPAMNMAYAGADGHIAMHPCGALPKRARGQGRIPLDGASGDNDWQGFIPRNELPLAIDPVGHYVASANGRPQPLGYPYYLGWMWDDSYRTRRIHELLAAAHDLTIETMRAIQYDHYDKCAERFLPSLLADVQADASLDSVAQQAREALAKWNYAAAVDTTGPTIWMRWFELYRDGVWRDEFKARGLDKTGGSWGFSGNNRREPMLEVLEYLTRELPNSVWFDDVSTPEREDRAAIARRTFAAAIDSLRKEFGEDPAGWTWGKTNVLHIGSLARASELSRDGGPVVGDDFTLNPGGGIGPVGGGASWRMIVDFGKPGGSVGVYPGGQMEDPASPHYDDLIALWAKGEYVALEPVAAAQLSADTKKNAQSFTP